MFNAVIDPVRNRVCQFFQSGPMEGVGLRVYFLLVVIRDIFNDNWSWYKNCHMRKDEQDVQINFCIWMRKEKFAKLYILHAFKLK